LSPLPLSPEALLEDERAMTRFKERERQKAHNIFACDLERYKQMLSDACIAGATPDAVKRLKMRIKMRMKRMGSSSSSTACNPELSQLLTAQIQAVDRSQGKRSENWSKNV